MHYDAMGLPDPIATLGQPNHRAISMDSKGKAICYECGGARGPTAKPHVKALCRKCAGSKWGRNHGRSHPVSLETVADKASRAPAWSWWAVPEAEWSAVAAAELPRITNQREVPEVES